MASYGHAAPAAAAAHPAQGVAYGAPIHVAPPVAPAGTFAPGTKIQVGSHRVVIQKYLSEGGFAHVYLVKLPKPVDGTDLAVLKRVAVPDKEALRGMRTEVETMKRLKGHLAIVTYIDSHASELRGGGYEVFLLMEYCNGGGLIDFMNTRLQHRLTEPEILHIFTDVAEGVACMHYLKPPLLHRDLKVENVLITVSGSARRFKLCDFGSAAPPRPAPTTTVECRLMDEDVQKHTTLQYRSPEMVDVYRKQPIDEKSDIWALGVLLYKLCYYTTPFEEQGQLAILNASYRFPSYPAFSDRLKKLIASMLLENQRSRPNIYQVLREACAMQGIEVPVKDIYSSKAHSEVRGNGTGLPAEKPQPAPVVGAVFAAPAPPQQVIPEVVPMRRGRPPAASQPPPPHAAKPSPSPLRVTEGDPFAALDQKYVQKAGAGDELSSRFPTLDQFSILHEKGSKFEFDDPTSPQSSKPKDLSERVSQQLADEAFAAPAPRSGPPAENRKQAPPEASRTKPYLSSPPGAQVPPHKPAPDPPKPSEMSRASAIINNTPELQAISAATNVYQPTPSRPTMVSTGTMTTPPPERPSSQYQIYRFPSTGEQRSSSLPRQSEPTGGAPQPWTSTPSNPRPADSSRASSFQGQPAHMRQPSSSRPSLEGGRPSLDLLEPVPKSRVFTNRPRPVSMHLESNLEYLREREGMSKPLPSPGLPSPRFPEQAPSPVLAPQDETNIASNVDFLRSMEDSNPKKAQHSKRSSMSNLTGKKSMLAGKFGDAFKRFEGGQSGGPALPRTPSPLKDLERRDLTPIAGSEATDGRSDDGQVLEEADDMTPEMRRELERRRLSQEEKRVAAAAAEYRRRVAEREPAAGEAARTGGSTGPTPLPKSIGGVSRAVSIQNRVQNLLDESTRSTTAVARTAEGYGRYSDPAAVATRPADGRPDLPRKPTGGGGPAPSLAIRPGAAGAAPPDAALGRLSAAGPTGLRGDPQRPTPPPKDGRPAAPPKPVHLNTHLTSGSLQGGGRRSASPPKPSGIPPALRGAGGPPPREFVMAAELPGQPALDMTPQEKDDYLRDFARRFPSLTSIEMVERDLAAEAAAAEAGGAGRPAGR